MPSEYASDPLWAKLRALRTAWARELKQSPFTIFTDQTLEALVRARPRSPHELAAIKGMGPYKLERYGTALIAAITGEDGEVIEPRPAPTPPRPNTSPSQPGGQRSRGADPEIDAQSGVRAAETPATQKPPRSPASTRSHVSTEEWTWRLLDRGFAPDEAAAIRGLDAATIVRHAAAMARQGRPVAITAFLTPETLAEWDDVPSDEGPPGPEPTPGLWDLFLACRGGKD